MSRNECYICQSHSLGCTNPVGRQDEHASNIAYAIVICLGFIDTWYRGTMFKQLHSFLFKVKYHQTLQACWNQRWTYLIERNKCLTTQSLQCKCSSYYTKMQLNKSNPNRAWDSLTICKPIVANQSTDVPQCKLFAHNIPNSSNLHNQNQNGIKKF